MTATKEQIKACFEAYSAADHEVSEAKALYESKLKSRSDTVHNILNTTGSKGPYNFNGSQVKIVCRGLTAFLRGKGAAGIDVD